MSTIVTRTVAEMPEQSRRHVEQLIGRTLNPDQRIFIIVDALYPASQRLERRPR